MSKENNQKIRIGLFHLQHGKCFYCGRDMWDPQLETKQDALLRLTNTVDTGRFTSEQRILIKASLCTLDHKYPRVLGGLSYHDNVVAACNDCNSRKGMLSIEEFLRQRES